MKRVLTALLSLMLLASIQSFAGSWTYSKVFPDTSFKAPTGVHGIAVDKAGKVWIAPFGKTDSIFNGATYTKTVGIFAFNPDGTPASFNDMKVIMFGSTPETLSTASWRGLRADANGNVVYAASNGSYYRLDYHNAQGIDKVKPNGSATVTPAFTSANEMFTANVAPGNPINIYGSDFGALGVAVTSSIGYSRGFEVSKDGNNIYWAGYSTQKVMVYHSDLGTIGTYALADSFAAPCQVESFAWNPKDGLLYMSSGPVDTIDYPGSLSPYSPEVWYGWDVTTKTVKDSIVWNKHAYHYPGYGLNGDTSHVDTAPRPRGIAFSVTGNTAYLASYNYSNAPVQMFVRTPTSVEPIKSGIPDGYKMSQNYPNPFNPTTEIEFSVPRAGLTNIRVYDILGREVATLVNENMMPGSYKVQFNASRLSSGTYIYELTSGTTRIVKSMMLIK